jgi:hypothetical protein
MLGWLSCALIALVVVLYVHSLVDCARTPEARIRFLPRWLWLLVMLWVPLLGTIAWVNLGKRPQRRDAEEPIRA